MRPLLERLKKTPGGERSQPLLPEARAEPPLEPGDEFAAAAWVGLQVFLPLALRKQPLLPGDPRLLLPHPHDGLLVGIWGGALDYRVAGAGAREQLRLELRLMITLFTV